MKYQDFIPFYQKLNYKCKSGTVDDSNKCNTDNLENIKSKLLELDNIISEIDKKLSDINKKISSYDKSKYTWSEWNKTSEFKRLDSEKNELYEQQHSAKVDKAFLIFKPPKGPQRQKFEKLVNISESAIQSISTANESISIYISQSTAITKELIERPDMVRTHINEDDIEKFKSSNNLDNTRWESRVHNAIVDLDNIIMKSKLPEDMTLYSGISTDFWNSLPKDIGTEFELPTFISSSVDLNVAKGFSVINKRRAQNVSQYIEIEARAGTPGIATEKAAIRQNPLGTWIIGEGGKQHAGGSQQEVILDRKQRYRIVSEAESDGKTFQKIKVETI